MRIGALLVDPEDQHLLSLPGWTFSGSYVTRQVRRDGKLRVQRLHRLIAGATSEQVDHKNGHPLDVRRQNLRLCTPQQNAQNRGLRKDSRTGAKGVTSHRGKFRVRIQVDGKLLCFGSYDTATEAQAVYRLAALAAFDEFARLA